MSANEGEEAGNEQVMTSLAKSLLKNSMKNREQRMISNKIAEVKKATLA